jgi:hypothetical protein
MWGPSQNKNLIMDRASDFSFEMEFIYGGHLIVFSTTEAGTICIGSRRRDVDGSGLAGAFSNFSRKVVSSHRKRQVPNESIEIVFVQPNTDRLVIYFDFHVKSIIILTIVALD